MNLLNFLLKIILKINIIIFNINIKNARERMIVTAKSNKMLIKVGFFVLISSFNYFLFIPTIFTLSIGGYNIK